MRSILSRLGSLSRSSHHGIYANVLELIGETPMVHLNHVPQSEGIQCEVVAKLEFWSPGGSHKDRIAKAMIEAAEVNGILDPHGDVTPTVIEATSGNTGIGLAVVTAVKNYKLVVTMPMKMSAEKSRVIEGLGGSVVRTPNVESDDPESNFAVAARLDETIENSVRVDQFGNPANPEIHYLTTGAEILEQTNGKVDVVVFSAGTGGVLSGVGRAVKEANPNAIVIGADPIGSTIAPADPSITLNWDPDIHDCDDLYFVEGIGYDFIPDTLHMNYVDYWIKTEDAPSFDMARRIIEQEGILCGGSSGAVLKGAVDALRILGLDQDPSLRVVVLFGDSIRNYLTKFLDDSWLEENELLL